MEPQTQCTEQRTECPVPSPIPAAETAAMAAEAVSPVLAGLMALAAAHDMRTLRYLLMWRRHQLRVHEAELAEAKLAAEAQFVEWTLAQRASFGKNESNHERDLAQWLGRHVAYQTAVLAVRGDEMMIGLYTAELESREATRHELERLAREKLADALLVSGGMDAGADRVVTALAALTAATLQTQYFGRLNAAVAPDAATVSGMVESVLHRVEPR